MHYTLSSIFYYPVKSLSSSNLKRCTIKKNLGILNDRLFSFSRNIDLKKAKLVEKFPKQRKLNNFLTLKNSPVLNKYKFSYNNKSNFLTLYKREEKIVSILTTDYNQHNLISNKILELESSIIEPIFLLKNKKFPFFDTTHSNKISNTISLLNINSIKDFEKKTKELIEFDRFRGNLYIDGINAWEERNWINKIIKINNIMFKVEKHISRCSAINLKPNTDTITINLPLCLNKHYNHTDMGLYLNPLNDGQLNIGDEVIIND